MNIKLNQILNLLASFNGEIINENHYKDFTNTKPINDANETSMVFVDKNAKNKDDLIAKTLARTIICDYIPDNEDIYKNKCLLVVNNPKLFFAKLVNQQLPTFVPQIHSSAVISPSAKIAKDCYIGPHVVVGENVEIGENTFIHSNCSIYDNVKIGRNVTIDAGCVIGAAGFGFVRDEEGVPTRFPQLGSVIIEDDVELGACVCIDRGALQDTILCKGVKTDNHIHVGHNVEVGEYSYLIAHTIIGGSTKIGKRCWIATSQISNKVTIGDDVVVGFGSLVLNSVPDATTYIRRPCRDKETIRKNTE